MKKLFALGSCLISLTAFNAYSLTAAPLSPVDFTSAIPNSHPILLPQDAKHFIVYTEGEMTLVDAVTHSVTAILPKPNPYENLQAVFALQNGSLLALDVTGLYTSNDLGKHWEKISQNPFKLEWYSFQRFLQNKAQSQNLFLVTNEKIFLSHDQ